VNKNYLETIRAENGKIYHLQYHQQRLDKALNLKGIHKLCTLLLPPKKGFYRCRVVYNRDEINIEYIKYTKRQVHSLKIVYDDTILYDKKYENRESLNTLFQKREDNDDILIIKNNLVTDTSIANIAFYDGTIWVTPKKPLLEGTTRQRLLESGKIIAKDIKVKEINSFKKLAIMNAMIDFAIIAEENIEDIIC